MTPREKVLAAVSRTGGCFYDSSGRGELIASAHTGRGFVWRATGCHTLAVNFHTDRPAGWRSLLEDIERGTDPCDEPDCEQCPEPWPCGDRSCLICEDPR